MLSKKNITQIAFTGLGAFCIAIAYIFNSNQLILWYDITKDLGIIFLSFVLLDILWSIAGEDFNNTKLAKYGLKDIYENPLNISDSLLIEQINSAKERIDLLGFTLSYISTSQDLCQLIENKINSGVKVRIAILSTQNLILQNLSGFKYLVYPLQAIDMLKSSIENFEKLRSRVKNENFEFKLIKDRPISYALRRFDDELMIVPYISNMNTIDSPVFVIKGERKILFQKYIKSFENLLSEQE